MMGTFSRPLVTPGRTRGRRTSSTLCTTEAQARISAWIMTARLAARTSTSPDVGSCKARRQFYAHPAPARLDSRHLEEEDEGRASGQVSEDLAPIARVCKCEQGRVAGAVGDGGVGLDVGEQVVVGKQPDCRGR